MGNPVVHFEIGAADADRSRAFYGSLFGWTVQTDGHGYGLVSTGSDAGIGGGIMPTPPGVQPWVTVYVAVDDVEKALARAEDLGGHRIMGPAAVGEAGRMAVFADPDGNPFGLFEQA